MKNRSKRVSGSTGVTRGMVRSRRLRQTSSPKSPRQTKKRSALSADSQSGLKPKMEGASQQVVRFELTAPSAREVFLAGTFNNWKYGATPMSRAEGGKWVAEFTLRH